MLSKPYQGPIPDDAWEVAERAWVNPFSIASDFARENALWVAFVASLGWITTITLDGLGYSRCWHITLAGASALKHREELSI